MSDLAQLDDERFAEPQCQPGVRQNFYNPPAAVKSASVPFNVLTEVCQNCCVTMYVLSIAVSGQDTYQMPEIDFKPESGESRMQSPSLYQQVEQSFTRNFQQQRNDQTSLKDLGFPDLSIVEASATHPADRHQSTAQQTSARELQLGMMAKAMGIDVTKNRDGSYDVKSPFDNPQQAAGGILNKVFNGLIGGSNDGSAPVGMNPWHARAWQGFPEDPRQRQQEEARRRQEEQQAKQRWERSGR